RGGSRDPPPFPTRRSSGLGRFVELPCAPLRLARGLPVNGAKAVQQAIPCRRSNQPLDALMEGLMQEHALRALRRQRIGDQVDRRSEEHTSELQSRENLVCR